VVSATLSPVGSSGEVAADDPSSEQIFTAARPDWLQRFLSQVLWGTNGRLRDNPVTSGG